MVPFSGMITHDGTVTFTHYDGRVYNVLPNHYAYAGVLTKLREVSADEDNTVLRDELFALSQPKRIVESSTGGRVKIENNTVFYDGQPVRNFLAERILWMVKEGFDAKPMLAFLENVKLNPSKRAVDELYRFMEANKMGITKDGMILAYKRVGDKYLDLYTGTMDNSVGVRVTMARNEVNDNPNETCKEGLHVCAMSYLPSYGAKRGNRVVICRIHPMDVVSVPIDYANAKMRVCAYDVIGEITDDLDDILGRSAVYDDGGDDIDESTNEDFSDWSSDDDEVEEAVDKSSLAVLPETCAAAANYDVFNFTAYVQSGALNTKKVFSFTDHLNEIRDIVVKRIGANLGLMSYSAVDTDRLCDLGADDLDVTGVVMDLEEEFAILIDESLFTPMTTVRELIDYVIANK